MSNQSSPLRAVLTGAVAGIAATLVMDQFLKLAASGQKAVEKHQKLAEGESPWAIAHEQAQQQQQAAHEEGSTEKVARTLAESAGRHLPKDRQKSAGQAVHYTFGTLMGMLYCVSAELLPKTAAAGGALFGTLLFVGADEIAVPALRLAPPPTQTAPVSHLEHWIAHVVYGTSLELARSILRRWL